MSFAVTHVILLTNHLSLNLESRSVAKHNSLLSSTPANTLHRLNHLKFHCMNSCHLPLPPMISAEPRQMELSQRA